MDRRRTLITYGLLPFIIFAFAFILRRIFFCGFILGDDIQEFGLVQHILNHGPFFRDQLHLRFGVWLFNVVFASLFGISETTFFLPTWLMSASLGVMAYFLLLAWGHARENSWLGGLFVASAPFEVFIGAVRANDLILSWVLAFALLAFFLLRKESPEQGMVLAGLLWFAFNVKLWAVYALPALMLYYIFQGLGRKEWRGFLSFAGTSLFLYGFTFILWKISVGSFFPFLTEHAATYPVPAKDMGWLLGLYPRMIFGGSEFGTTLFGSVPYLLAFFLLLKAFFSLFPQKQYRLDGADVSLFIYYGSFFLLLNYFPNSFKFDQYYSVPRIFRYLAPLSFPMTLHLAKMVLDLCRIDLKRPVTKIILSRYLPALVFVPLILINLFQAHDATRPGRLQRRTLMAVVREVKEQSPPALVAESWLAFFLREVYLSGERDRIEVVEIPEAYTARDYEKWLKKNRDDLAPGTLLLSGLGSYVHYGNLHGGIRLEFFREGLDPAWELLREYEEMSFLPRPEPARLWRLSGTQR